MEYDFANRIKKILKKQYLDKAGMIYDKSSLLQYINTKTQSVGRNPKSRSSFASLYALYALIEDYINGGFDGPNAGAYRNYEGVQYSYLIARIHSLPFGAKLQNHALNNRLNSEFLKYFPMSEFEPVLRDMRTRRYWINENLLIVNVDGKTLNIAKILIQVLKEYISIKEAAFKSFMDQCKRLRDLECENMDEARNFVRGLLAPNVDARVFEVVSYAILKNYYRGWNVYWGFSPDSLNEETLMLYKTGRTNANDGGIDFVMRPLGKFFQVTESLNFRKYFLDIDKIERYPITFVVKSEEEDTDKLRAKIQSYAEKTYGVKTIVDKYMNCIEELITIPILMKYFDEVEKGGRLADILNEIVLQSKVEFNYDED